MRAILWVALGGAVGAIARYLIGRWAVEKWGGTFPYGTLFVNVTGSLFLGFLVALSVERLHMPAAITLFLSVGFCGAYTTFSTFSVDTIGLAEIGLAERGMLVPAIGNVLLNNLLSLSAAFLGLTLGRLLPVR